MNERLGCEYDQNLDRSIIVMMDTLRRRLKIKTRDLACKSLVFTNSTDDLKTIEYIILCIEIASQFTGIV